MRIHLLLVFLVAVGGLIVGSGQGECPKNKPTGESCDLGQSVTCDYGELCCPGEDGCGNPKESCTCGEEGFWDCEFKRISCPDICPNISPVYGDYCVMTNQFYCGYGDLCCGDDCIPEEECICYDSTFFSCVENDYTDPCPLLCPKSQPSFGESCNIDPQIQCSYNQGGCSLGTESEYAVTCNCIGTFFHCYNSCFLNVFSECPDLPPYGLNGYCDFVEPYETCNYGVLCCPGEEGCGKPDMTCECNEESGNFSCSLNVISCPQACPSTQPLNNESCGLNYRITCDYGELCRGEDCIPETTCRCYAGSFYCSNNTYTSPCPEAKPEFGDPCDFDYRFLCYYDQGACSSLFTPRGYSLECRCLNDGHFDCYNYCQDNISECPAWPFGHYGFCNFANPNDPSEVCSYGELCCPGDEGCEGQPSVNCTCIEEYGYFFCSYNVISCPQTCPSTQPLAYDSCDLSDRILCNYRELCCGEDCIPEITCRCYYGMFICNDNTITLPCHAPSPAPSLAPDPLNICFSGDVTVHVKTRGAQALKDVQLGDKILVAILPDGAKQYEAVYSFGHKNAIVIADYLAIATEGSAVEISACHMMQVEDNRFLPASMLKVGDKVMTATGDLVSIQAISQVKRQGAYAPYTASGKLIVNDLVVSNYIAYQDSEYLLLGDYKTPFTYQWLGHAFASAHRLVGTTDMYTKEGVVQWVHGPHQMALWVLAQDPRVAMVMLLPAVALAGLLSWIQAFIGSPWLVVALIMIVAATKTVKSNQKCNCLC